MTGTLIATTEKAAAHALAFQGIMVYSCFPQIRDMLMRKFGDEYVLLFAKPVENVQTNEIDWYTPVNGTPKSLKNVAPEARAAACEKAASMAKDIQAYAEELIQSPDPLKVTRGNILRLALSYPDESYIYVIGEQPVFICWGFGPGAAGVEPKDLSRLAVSRPVSPPRVEKTPPAADAPAATAGDKGRSIPFAWAWLWWLLPLLVACLLILFLFTSFGGEPPLGGTAIFHGPELPFLAEAPDHSHEISVLRNEIDDLRLKLDQHIALCIPEKAPIAVAPQASAPALSTPPPAEIPILPEDSGVASDSLVIPEEAQDASFLEGRWLCETGLANTRTNEPVQFAFEFGANGAGTGTVYEKSDTCAGATRAEMQNGELMIHVDPQICAKSGGKYMPLNIVCKNAAGASAICQGVNEDGSTWSANFRRVK